MMTIMNNDDDDDDDPITLCRLLALFTLSTIIAAVFVTDSVVIAFIFITTQL